MDYKEQINITSSDFGSKVIYCSDEFFADSGRMLQDSEPLWIEGKYDENGKWMDGWESRRRRDGKNDFCSVVEKSVSSLFCAFLPANIGCERIKLSCKSLSA